MMEELLFKKVRQAFEKQKYNVFLLAFSALHFSIQKASSALRRFSAFKRSPQSQCVDLMKSLE